MTPTIHALAERLRLAEDELYRIQQADGFCMVNGAYDRAQTCVRAAQRDIADAELLEAMRDPAYWRDRERGAVERVQSGLTAIVCAGIPIGVSP